MIIKYDKEAKTISIQLVPSNPIKYVYSEEITSDVLIDRDTEGNATAVEVLGIDGIEDYEGNKLA